MIIGRTFLILLSGLLLGPGVATALAQQEAAAKPPVVSHELEGRAECLMCHSGAMEGMPAVPESHEGRENSTCLWCHAADATIQTVDVVPPIPHELEGRDECGMCHASGMEGMPQSPADHEGRPNDSCGLCHEPSA